MLPSDRTVSVLEAAYHDFEPVTQRRYDRRLSYGTPLRLIISKAEIEHTRKLA